MQTTPTFYFGTRALADRYKTTTRTIKRWKKAGKLPQPTKLPNGRDGWANATIEQYEKSLVGGGSAAA
jgi:predicted DNA-binding transcriptional regulator AlpA